MSDGNSGLFFWDMGFEMWYETDQNNAGKEVNALIECPHLSNPHTERSKLHTENLEIKNLNLQIN